MALIRLFHRLTSKHMTPRDNSTGTSDRTENQCVDEVRVLEEQLREDVARYEADLRELAKT